MRICQIIRCRARAGAALLAGTATVAALAGAAPASGAPIAADIRPAPAVAATEAHFFYGGGRASRGTGTTTGAQAQFTVHRPGLRGDWHSLAELAVTSPDGQQIVEVGWRVDTDLFPDDQPRLFVYHWINGQETCNNGCGFVPDGPGNSMLGAPFAVDSTQLFMINHEVSGTGKW